MGRSQKVFKSKSEKWFVQFLSLRFHKTFFSFFENSNFSNFEGNLFLSAKNEAKVTRDLHLPNTYQRKSIFVRKTKISIFNRLIIIITWLAIAKWECHLYLFNLCLVMVFLYLKSVSLKRILVKMYWSINLHIKFTIKSV